MYKNRNLFVQLLLYVVTLGLYGIYWYYSTANEIIKAGKIQGSAGLWTVLFLIPIVNLYAYWKHASAVNAATDGTHGTLGLFLLAVIFYPIYWIIVQNELNSRSSQQFAT